jgi:hypothetical protein
MRLVLHPDVYAAIHKMGIFELDDRMVTYLVKLPPEKACSYIRDENIFAMIAKLSGTDDDKDVAKHVKDFGVDPTIISAANSKGYEMNANFASFLNGMTIDDALDHIATMRSRKKRLKLSAT